MNGPVLEPGVITCTGEWVFCNVQKTQSGNPETKTQIHTKDLCASKSTHKRITIDA